MEVLEIKSSCPGEVQKTFDLLDDWGGCYTIEVSENAVEFKNYYTGEGHFILLRKDEPNGLTASFDRFVDRLVEIRDGLHDKKD